MTTPDLIETVSRALCFASGWPPDYSLGGDKENFLWMEYEHEARAAIRAVLLAQIEAGGCIADCVSDWARDHQIPLTDGGE